MGRALRMLFAFAVSVIAAAVTLAVLSARWAAGQLEAASQYDDPMRGFAGIAETLFISMQIAPALAILPAAAAIILGEVLRIHSLLYYVAIGGLAAVLAPLAAGAGYFDYGYGEQPPAAESLTVIATAGFAAGFSYWLLAGRNA